MYKICLSTQDSNSPKEKQSDEGGGQWQKQQKTRRKHVAVKNQLLRQRLNNRYKPHKTNCDIGISMSLFVCRNLLDDLIRQIFTLFL